jgi:hypothetical protein
MSVVPVRGHSLVSQLEWGGLHPSFIAPPTSVVVYIDRICLILSLFEIMGGVINP